MVSNRVLHEDHNGILAVVFFSVIIDWMMTAGYPFLRGERHGHPASTSTALKP